MLARLETLPLTHLEQYIYFMHCPSHPWIGHTRLIFKGQIDARLLQNAIHIALKKHPLLSSMVISNKKKLYWKFIDNPSVEIPLLEGTECDSYPRVVDIELAKEIGIKVFLKHLNNQQSAVYLQVHHACCDGQGLSFFLQDLFIAYDKLHGNSIPSFPSPPLSELQHRAIDGPVTKRCQLLCKQLPGLAAIILLLVRNRQGISTKQIVSRNTATATPHHCERKLDRDITKNIALAARKLKVTSNDLLLRELMLAIGEWKQVNGFYDNNSWFKMMVPVTMRSRKDYHQTAINKFSMVMIERQHKAMLKPRRLLQRIQEDMNAIKRFELGYTFLFLLTLASYVPGGIRRLAHSDLFASSSVFSNLGKLFQRCPLPKQSGYLVVGPTQLIQVDALAVVSYPQCASFIASQYAGSLNINMVFNPYALDSTQSNDILDKFIERLKSTATQAVNAH